MEQRPILNKNISLKDFKEFYWLKEELVRFCKGEGLRTTGSKIEIAQRISHYITTGEKQSSRSVSKNKSKSKFDWKNESLTTDTVITDNYKNTENVRAFFEKEIGSNFKFNVKFMNWIKENVGKTLEDAMLQWHTLKSQAASDTSPKEIAPQFEYNTYLRDFLVDNPTLKRELGIKLWRIKKSLRGSNKYEKQDLKLLKD